MQASADTSDQKREKLLTAKLGDLLTWTKPELVETTGPYNPEAFDAYDAFRREVISDCEEWLRQRSDKEISILAGDAPQEFAGKEVRWPHELEQRIKRANKFPPWYAGGFGHPDHVADFEYWGKMAHFSTHELLCLSVGVDPKSISESWLHGLAQKDPSGFWPPLQFLLRRREQLDRAFPLGRKGQSTSPRRFLEWAEKVSFEAHPEFLRLLRRYHAPAAVGGEGPAKAGEQNKREVDKIAQLFTAMAIEYYGYDPRMSRSPVPKEITDLAHSMGLEVSNDTVRKYLKIGASFIPDEWEPNSSKR